MAQSGFEPGTSHTKRRIIPLDLWANWEIPCLISTNAASALSAPKLNSQADSCSDPRSPSLDGNTISSRTRFCNWLLYLIRILAYFIQSCLRIKRLEPVLNRVIGLGVLPSCHGLLNSTRSWLSRHSIWSSGSRQFFSWLIGIGVWFLLKLPFMETF